MHVDTAGQCTDADADADVLFIDFLVINPFGAKDVLWLDSMLLWLYRDCEFCQRK